eukprot:SAG31_NODE_3977_length_3702_cov_1.536775_1_plen_36_part_00
MLAAQEVAVMDMLKLTQAEYGMMVNLTPKQGSSLP